jgi:hypothetical protein
MFYYASDDRGRFELYQKGEFSLAMWPGSRSKGGALKNIRMFVILEQNKYPFFLIGQSGTMKR